MFNPEEMQRPGGHEIIEQHYERLERTSRFHCYERNDAEACHELAEFLDKKKKNFKMAFEAYKDNCLKNGYGKSCFQYGQYLYHGTKAEQNKGEAFKAYKRGCDAKNYSGAACDSIGLLYNSEEATPDIIKIRGQRNPKKAVECFAKACEGDDGVGCVHAAMSYHDGFDGFKKPDPALHFKYSKKACDLMIREGCHLLSEAYKKGIGTEPNEKLSEHYNRLFQLMSGGAKPNYKRKR